MLTVREAAALPHTPEIRRYSHVGRLYLRDGDVPVRMLNDRESASVPEHIRNDSRFIYPIGFPLESGALSAGLRISYLLRGRFGLGKSAQPLHQWKNLRMQTGRKRPMPL